MLRILMLSPMGNPALDMVYHGLRSLGHEVIEYPTKSYLQDGGLRLTATGFEGHNLSGTEILHRSRNGYFDLMVCDRLGSDIEYSMFQVFDSYLEGNERYVVIDQTGLAQHLSEDFWKSHPYQDRLPAVCFVRTMPRRDMHVEQTPLQMAVRRDWNGPLYEVHTTRYLSVFLGILYLNFCDAHYRRLLVHDTFEEFPGCYFNRSQKFYEREYAEIIAQSLTAVNVKGMVWDCWRFWEILNVGSCLITEDYSEVMTFDPPFENGEHLITFRFQFDYSSDAPLAVNHQLKSILRWAEENRDEVEKIARRGREFALNCHSTINRAETVLKYGGLVE